MHYLVQLFQECSQWHLRCCCTKGQNTYGKENTGKKQGQFTRQEQLNEATQGSNTKSKLKPFLNHKLNCSAVCTAKVERELAGQEPCWPSQGSAPRPPHCSNSHHCWAGPSSQQDLGFRWHWADTCWQRWHWAGHPSLLWPVSCSNQCSWFGFSLRMGDIFIF